MSKSLFVIIFIFSIVAGIIASVPEEGRSSLTTDYGKFTYKEYIANGGFNPNSSRSRYKTSLCFNDDEFCINNSDVDIHPFERSDTILVLTNRYYGYDHFYNTVTGQKLRCLSCPDHDEFERYFRFEQILSTIFVGKERQYLISSITRNSERLFSMLSFTEDGFTLNAVLVLDSSNEEIRYDGDHQVKLNEDQTGIAWLAHHSDVCTLFNYSLTDQEISSSDTGCSWCGVLRVEWQEHKDSPSVDYSRSSCRQ